MILADGSQVELSTYYCQLEWFGRIRELEVIANSGQPPLLSVGLLLAKKLPIDYTNLELTLELKAKRDTPESRCKRLFIEAPLNLGASFWQLSAWLHTQHG